MANTSELHARLEAVQDEIDAAQARLTHLLTLAWPVRCRIYVRINSRHKKPVAAVVISHRGSSVVVVVVSPRKPERAVHFRDVVGRIEESSV